MIDFVLVQRALVAWVRTATSLAANNVYFGSQELLARPPGKCCVLVMGGLQMRGQEDELRSSFNIAAPAGEEWVYTLSGHRVFSVEVHCFSEKTVTNDSLEATARNLASAVQVCLGLPSVRDALNAAGLGVLQHGDVLWRPAIKAADSVFEGRALVETLFSIQQSATDTVGYFDTVNVTPNLSEE